MLACIRARRTDGRMELKRRGARCRRSPDTQEPDGLSPVSVHVVLRAVLHAMPVAALVLDSHRRIILANEAGRALAEEAPETPSQVANSSAERQTKGPIHVAEFAVGQCGTYRLVLHLRYIAGGLERSEKLAAQWKLTPRQKDVLSLVAQGARNTAIAARLGCSLSMVEAHVTALLQKAGCSRRTQLIARYLRGIESPTVPWKST